MKLKLNTQGSDSRRASTTADIPQTPGGSLKLTLNKAAIAASPASSTKKRPVDDTNGAEPPAPKRSKTIKLQSSQKARKPSIIRLKRTDTAASPTTPGGSIRPSLKIKHKGKLPPRPLGEGYDSECDDAEADPAIEENFILRMAPGPDAEYIRKAIEERKIGVPVRDGGADVNLRFFQKDARRACIRVQDRYYSAVLVDLPCIVESMKSWDKKGWWKAADICQMLLVTGRVDIEDKARDAPLPKEVDKETWAWPHGLTPPMYDVRRRRFRRRTNYRSVEQLEAEVERLLEEDAKAMERGGSTRCEVMTFEELKRQEEGPEEEEEEEADYEDDAEGEYDEGGYDDADMQEDEELVANLENVFGEQDDDDEPEPDISAAATPVAVNGEVAAPAAVVEVEHSASQLNGADTVAIPNRDEIAVELVPETQQDTPSQAAMPPTSPSDDDNEDISDEDDDDDEASDEELSEEAREKRERETQQKEEIAHLERQIAEKKKQLDATPNPLLRTRLLTTIKRFEEDRDVKRRGLGLPVGDEDDGE